MDYGGLLSERDRWTRPRYTQVSAPNAQKAAAEAGEALPLAPLMPP